METNIQQIWKDIPDYEGRYQVSNFGEVKSLKRKIVDSLGRPRTIPEKIITGYIDPSTGYSMVNLMNQDKVRHTSVHRLVASLFIPNPDHKPQVNHINFCRYDNRFENLEWVTAKENANHSVKAGRRDDQIKKESKPIAQLNLNGDLVKVWPSGRRAARELGIIQGGISMVARGKQKRYMGFIWRFA